jgi:integrase
MPSAKLTDPMVRAVKADGKRQEYWDTIERGLCLRVSPRGAKIFYVRYRFGNRRRRLKLGPYPRVKLAEARQQAGTLRLNLAMGEDPQVKKREAREAITFADLADEYLDKHARRKKKAGSCAEDERVIENELKPRWRDRTAANLRRRDVMDLLDTIVDRGAPIMANRVKALVSKIFNFGVGRDLVEYNPCFGLPMPAKEQPRDRVLTDDEIRAVWRALDEEDPITGGAFKLRLLTAQRGIEVLSMRWADIDGAWWTIPAEVAKNGLPHRVPFSPQVREILDGLEPITGSSVWVFPSSRKPEQHLGRPQKALRRIRRASSVGFQPHDLRRTVASLMTGMGIARLVVSKILNHAEQGVTAVYDRHSYDAEKRQALLRWGQRVEEIVTEAEPSEIVRIA